MKFINYLESITGIGIFPLISLIIFVGFFTVVLLYVLRMDKKHIDKMSNVPLESGFHGEQGENPLSTNHN